MHRVEEIKEKVKSWEGEPCLTTEEAEYLLSRLEIAEKALELINGVYIPFLNRETVETVETMKDMAKKALQQIRS